MRVNKFVARASGLSRRAADTAISNRRIMINGKIATLGQELNTTDKVELDGRVLTMQPMVTIALNKPVGYVCSREGQGNPTIYDLLPKQFHNLKPIGRLDKDSSGLLLLTNDGQLAQDLSHPSQQKFKVYEISLDKSLTKEHKQQIEEGLKLEDGISKLKLTGNVQKWTATMYEGRNRQIRRTFAVLGYKVTELQRTQFGEYNLNIKSGHWQKI